MVTMTVTRKATTSTINANPNPCKKKCPGGYKCNCNSEVGHTLHICMHKDCWCHSQDRYEGRPYKAQA